MTVTVKPELVLNGLTSTVYLDGIQTCQFFTAAIEDDRYPCPYDGLQFGRQRSAMNEYECQMSCE